jgi:hypothetical protein
MPLSHYRLRAFVVQEGKGKNFHLWLFKKAYREGGCGRDEERHKLLIVARLLYLNYPVGGTAGLEGTQKERIDAFIKIYMQTCSRFYLLVCARSVLERESSLLVMSAEREGAERKAKTGECEGR